MYGWTAPLGEEEEAIMSSIGTDIRGVENAIREHARQVGRIADALEKALEMLAPLLTPKVVITHDPDWKGGVPDKPDPDFASPPIDSSSQSGGADEAKSH